MAKISRPVIYTLVIGVVAYGYVVLTEPDAAKRKPAARRGASAATAPDGFLPEDLSARFPRYLGAHKNAFAPGVVAKKASEAPQGTALTSDLALWSLTGISVVDGVRSALLEKISTGDIAFLKAGDHWLGMTVAAIEPDTIVFVSAEGKPLRMTFVDPTVEQAASTATSVAPVVVTGLPPRPGASPVPPATGPTVPLGLQPGGGAPTDSSTLPRRGRRNRSASDPSQRMN